MALLFLLALVLAWPTFGLSILAWLALAFFKSKTKVDAIAERENRKALVEPIFGGRFADFFRALDMPILYDHRMDEATAHQCGRHIMNYLAHNPQEGALFMQGLKKWATKGSNQLCDPVTAAEAERSYDAKGEIHLVSYRAVEALMTNNKGLACFHSIDFGKLVTQRTMLDLRSALKPSFST
jgi:hypothetical protein